MNSVAAESISPWTQLGAVGVLGTAFLLVLRWMLHKMSGQLDDVGKSIRALALVQLDMHKTLIMHDAQIRGVNPSAGKDETDAHATARDEYEKVLAALNATSETIRATLVRKPEKSVALKLPI